MDHLINKSKKAFCQEESRPSVRPIGNLYLSKIWRWEIMRLQVESVINWTGSGIFVARIKTGFDQKSEKMVFEGNRKWTKKTFFFGWRAKKIWALREKHNFYFAPKLFNFGGFGGNARGEVAGWGRGRRRKKIIFFRWIRVPSSITRLTAPRLQPRHTKRERERERGICGKTERKEG